MTREEQAWFEEAEGLLDPGLVHELSLMRKQGIAQETIIPVIVRLDQEIDDRERKRVLDLCQSGACCVDGQINMLNSICAQLLPETIHQLTQHDGVVRIYYDRKVQALLDVASRSVKAIKVQSNEGLSGKGITIAIIDTGIHPHPDLVKPNNRITAVVDFVGNQLEPYDDHGHGTHCAGDAAGNGYQSEGEYISPAPEADLVGIKVLDAEGGGRLSNVIQGIEWCMERRQELGIRVISLSLGAPAYESYRDDPLAQAVEKAWYSGIVVCAAAGNEGPSPRTISTPGIDPVIITVGSADDKGTVPRKDDEKADYSSRGPTPDLLVKPDIYAPGTNIVSLSVPGSPLEKKLPEERVGEGYIRLSGTSMATPICAGVVALMLEANPLLSPNDVKSILMSTAQQMSGDQAGYLDAQSAVKLARSYREFQHPAASSSTTA